MGYVHGLGMAPLKHMHGSLVAGVLIISDRIVMHGREAGDRVPRMGQHAAGIDDSQMRLVLEAGTDKLECSPVTRQAHPGDPADRPERISHMAPLARMLQIEERVGSQDAQMQVAAVALEIEMPDQLPCAAGDVQPYSGIEPEAHQGDFAAPGPGAAMCFDYPSTAHAAKPTVMRELPKHRAHSVRRGAIGIRQLLDQRQGFAGRMTSLTDSGAEIPVHFLSEALSPFCSASIICVATWQHDTFARGGGELASQAQNTDRPAQPMERKPRLLRHLPQRRQTAAGGGPQLADQRLKVCKLTIHTVCVPQVLAYQAHVVYTANGYTAQVINVSDYPANFSPCPPTMALDWYLTGFSVWAVPLRRQPGVSITREETMSIASCSRRNFLGSAAATVGAMAANGLASSTPAAADTRPNILWLSIEDMDPLLGCYGDRAARTPVLDQLAAEGVVYTNACCVAGVCAPSRTGIITGMDPCAFGAIDMRSEHPLPGHMKGFPAYLKQAGYYCTNNSKTDYQDSVSVSECWSSSSSSAHWKNRPAGAPFFAVFNSMDSHENSTAHRTGLTLRDCDSYPPYFPDTARAKSVWESQYYALEHDIEPWVKSHLDELKSAGVFDDTIIVFWSDHGSAVPRHKRWPHNSGIRNMLIVRIPEKCRVNGEGSPGSHSDELISMMDLGPTMLSLAGLDAPSHMEGQAFLGAKRKPPRTYLFAGRGRVDERVDMVRSVRTRRYIYLRNFMPWEPWSRPVWFGETALMREWRKAAENGTLSESGMRWFSQFRDHEELYDLEDDPFEITNLASSPQHQSILDQLRSVLIGHMEAVQDTGLIPEPFYNTLTASGDTLYEAARADGENFTAKYLAFVGNVYAGENAIDALIDGLDDPDPVIRYWALIGVGNWAPHASAAKSKCIALLNDPELTVRLAAARAVCYLGEPDKGLPVLKDAVHPNNDRYSTESLNATFALNFIDPLNNMAASERSWLEGIAAMDKRMYPKRVADYALKDLDKPPEQPWLMPPGPPLKTASTRTEPCPAGAAPPPNASAVITGDMLLLGVPGNGRFRYEIIDVRGRQVAAGTGRCGTETRVRLANRSANRYIVHIRTGGRHSVRHVHAVR